MPVCERHKVETLLRCGRCEKPICPDCTVMGPVGARCRDCSALRHTHIYQVDPKRLPAAWLAGSAAGFASAYLLELLSAGYLGAFWLMFLAGSAAGEIVLRVSGRKRGIVIEAVTGTSVGAGFVAGLVAHAMLAAGPEWAAALTYGLDVKFFGLVVGLIVALSRIRFL